MLIGRQNSVYRGVHDWCPPRFVNKGDRMRQARSYVSSGELLGDRRSAVLGRTYTPRGSACPKRTRWQPRRPAVPLAFVAGITLGGYISVFGLLTRGVEFAVRATARACQA